MTQVDRERIINEIIEHEKHWAGVIQQQDVERAQELLADSYFLAVAVQDQPLRIAPRDLWLESLQHYKTNSFQINDIRVQVYGEVAIVVMLYTQQGTFRGQDRSAQFFITDVWIWQGNRWRVAERHSSRPEPSGGAPPTSST